MKLQQVNATERISFQERACHRGSNHPSKAFRIGRLENDGDENASSDPEDPEAQNEQSESSATHVSNFSEDVEIPLRKEDSLDSLLDRLKNAHRLDLRL